MAINISSLVSTVENLLVKNNTTTAGSSGSLDISNGLANRVLSFYKGIEGLHDNISIPKISYPAICIELVDKREDHLVLGSGARRNIEITMNIVPITMREFSGVESEGLENADNEIILLTQNIENLFRNFVRLSTTADQGIKDSTIISTSYNTRMRESIYNKMSTITLLIKAYTT